MIERRSVVAAAVALVGCPLVAGCGFRPVYGRGGAAASTDVRAALAAVRIQPLSDRTGMRLGQVLREKLQTAGVRSSFELQVRLSQQTQELGVRRDSTTSRANLVFAADIALFENGERVFVDAVQSIVSYNILDDQYATVASQADAVDRALVQVGEEIRTRLAIYFDRRLRPRTAAR
ncbi:MAG: hypothetical protein SFV21_18265 [Rhodospirillaceae bacterium]|nr:hypothetical protein [Rhodospirillaceae bacterium]